MAWPMEVKTLPDRHCEDCDRFGIVTLYEIVGPSEGIYKCDWCINGKTAPVSADSCTGGDS